MPQVLWHVKLAEWDIEFRSIESQSMYLPHLSTFLLALCGFTMVGDNPAPGDGAISSVLKVTLCYIVAVGSWASCLKLFKNCSAFGFPLA